MINLSDIANLPPRLAVEFLKSKGLRLSFDWQDTLAEAHDRAFTITKVLEADLLQQARESLAKAISRGETFEGWRKQLPQELRALGKQKLKTIYRTNLQGAYAQARDDWATKAGIPYYQYVAVLDQVTRPTHAALSGKVFAADDPFWVSFSPPLGYRCFPAGEMVDCKPIGGSKTWYSGKIYEITTAGGNRIAVTPNHPVLTKDGWVLAGDIKQGNNLVCTGRNIKPICFASVNNQNCIALAEDIFDSLALHGSGRSHVTNLDFNGDGQFCQGDVHVVGSNSFLRDVADTTGRQLIPEKSFIVSHASKPFFSLLRKLILKITAVCSDVKNRFNNYGSNKSLIRVNLLGNEIRSHSLLVKFNYFVSDCISHVGRFFSPSLSYDSILPKPLFLWRRNATRPFNLFLLGLSSLFNSSVSDKFFDGLPGTSVCFSELQEAISREILFDDVIGVREYDYSGHVYDFTTTNGLIISNNIISSNCRCRKVPRSARWVARNQDKLESSNGKISKILRRLSNTSGVIEEAPVYAARQADGSVIDVTPDRGWSRNWEPDLKKYDRDIRAGLEAALEARQRAITLPTGIEIPANGLSRYRAASEAVLGKLKDWQVDTEVTRRGGYVAQRGDTNKRVLQLGRALAIGGSRVQIDGNQFKVDGERLTLAGLIKIVVGGLWQVITRK